MFGRLLCLIGLHKWVPAESLRIHPRNPLDLVVGPWFMILAALISPQICRRCGKPRDGDPDRA